MLNIAMSITPYLPLVAKRASVLHGSVLDANHLAKWVSFECKTTLSIQFQLPIVGDGVQWKNQANKKEGYKIKKGKQVTSLTVQKKDPRWSKTPS
jgi:hypothetical protein